MTEPQLDTNQIDGILEVFKTGGRSAQVEVESLDLNRPSPIPRGTLEALQIRHEQAAKAARGTVRRVLGRDIGIEFVSLQQDRFGSFRESLQDPCCAFVWEMAPLRQPAYFIMDFGLAYACMDRLLGGSGDPSGDGRDLTSTEVAVLNEVQGPIVGALASAWHRYVKLSPRLMKSITVPRFLREIPADDAVVVVRFAVSEFMEDAGFLLVMPLAGLEAQLLSGRNDEPEEPKEETQAALVDHMRNVSVDVRVLIGAAQVPVRQLTTLAEGDVVVLERRVRDTMELQVEGQTKFKGRLHRCAGSVVFQVEDPRALQPITEPLGDTKP